MVRLFYVLTIAFFVLLFSKVARFHSLFSNHLDRVMSIKITVFQTQYVCFNQILTDCLKVLCEQEAFER